jgi:hypothetical protein
LLGRDKGSERLLFFESPPRLRLKSGGQLYMQVMQAFTVIREGGSFKANTRSYHYALLESPAEQGQHGIFTYQWHPDRTKKLKWPHLHVIPRKPDPYLGHDKHFPTARMCIEDFVYLLIRDYDVRSRMPYDQWREILRRNKSAFVKSASWGLQYDET